jgi:hypothetical protein
VQELRTKEELDMSGNTATPAIMLAAGTLLAGLASALAAEAPATFAKPALTENAESSASPTKAKACPAVWLTTPDGYPKEWPKTPKTQKGKPEHKGNSQLHKPPFFGRKPR